MRLLQLGLARLVKNNLDYRRAMEQWSSLEIPGLQVATDLQPSPSSSDLLPAPRRKRGLLLPFELDIIYEHVSPTDIPFFSFLSLRKRDKMGQLKLIFTLNEDF